MTDAANAPELVIGIDLGTTNSLAAVYDAERTRACSATRTARR